MHAPCIAHISCFHIHIFPGSTAASEAQAGPVTCQAIVALQRNVVEEGKGARGSPLGG